MSALYRTTISALDRIVPAKLQPLWQHPAVTVQRMGLEINTDPRGCHAKSAFMWQHAKNRFCGMSDTSLLSVLMKKQAESPKTVFFWAPAFKWGLVIAGISDLQRPVDQLSIAQSASLAATGVIWSRYSLVIIPKNYSLFSVNLFVATTQLYQLYRAISYHRNLGEKNAQ